MKKVVIVPSLVITLLLVVFIGTKVANNDNKNSDETPKELAIMLESNPGEYEKINVASYAEVVANGYVFNSDLSTCDNGSVLSWDNEKKAVIFNRAVSDTCNVYFDKISTFASYITNIVYTEDGVNGLYYHDGTGTYENANLEAGDGSYRYAGKYSYPKASEGYDDIDKIITDPPRTGGVPEKCIGYRCGDYVLSYDSTGTYYNFTDALQKAINDGYIIDDAINNYLCFNEGCTDDEKFRIIGVINNKVKIIKMTSVGNYYWDENGSTYLEYSTIMGVLHDYYQQLTEYLYEYNIDLDGLVDYEAQWAAEGVNNGEFSTIEELYTMEQLSESLIYSPVGLMYVSDYVYASNPISWENIGYPTKESTWMGTENSSEWMISSIPDYGYYAFCTSEEWGDISTAETNTEKATRPVFSLLPEVKYISGDGTSTNPYIVGL